MATGAPISPATTRVGWIGTGVMGLPMCAHLIAAGYSLTVFNRTPSKSQPLIDLGARFARFAPSPLAVAAHSDVVFSIVGHPSDVRSVLIAPSSGAFHGLRAGSVLVDMSTSEPSLAVEIAAAAAAKNCASIDAPVSGGEPGARAATLSIFAGGDEDAIRRLEPLFRCLGTVRYMGGPGKGQFAKLANQITIASSMVGLAEGIVYAYKGGLDLERNLEGVLGGEGGSRSVELYGREMIRREFEGGALVSYFVKDFGICLRECEKMGVVLPGLALAQQLYVSLQAHGERGLGNQALVLALERLNNVKVEASNSNPTS